MTNNRPEVEEAYTRAVDAARRGDANGMIHALYDCHLLDGVYRVLRNEWFRAVSASDVADCIADAVGKVFEQLYRGARVRHLYSYILKTAENRLYDLVEKRVVLSDEDAELVPADEDGETLLERAEREQRRAEMRAEALRRARELLPQLGQENIRRVMEAILDAVQNEVPEISDQEIAEITGLKRDTVRQLRNRGLKRLRRLATESGIEIVSDSLPSEANDEVEVPDEERGT